jgi:hypothetical protein
MAYLMDTDDDDVIHATTHGIMSRDDLSFLRERMDSAMRSAGSYASDFLRSASEKLASFDLGRLRDKVEGMRDRFHKRWEEDRIGPIMNLSAAQNAKSVNRKYTMADTRIRRLYQLGRLDGYGRLYEDEEPGALGRDHTPYREVMNGAHEVVDGEDRFTTFMGVCDEHGDAPLSVIEKHTVRDSWKVLYDLLDQGKQDPTSPLRKTL